MGVAQTVPRDFVQPEKKYSYALNARLKRRGWLQNSNGSNLGDIVYCIYQFVDFRHVFVLNLVSKGIDQYNSKYSQV
jgi:hypothetical protein